MDRKSKKSWSGSSREFGVKYKEKAEDEKMSKFLQECGIVVHYAMSYTSKQDDIAGKSYSTLKDMIRGVSSNFTLPKSL